MPHKFEKARIFLKLTWIYYFNKKQILSGEIEFVEIFKKPE